MMPCLFLHFSGARDGRKAKLGSDGMPFSPQLSTDAHQNGHKKCLPEEDLSLQKGLTSWRQNQNLSKIYTSKNYGVSCIT